VVAARRIAEDMQAIGLDVTLVELSWREYQEALKNPRDEDGKPTWDMYYAEVALTPDWDVLPLVEALPEDSFKTNLNFGKWDMPVVEDAAYAYLKANDDTRASALESLMTQITSNGIIIPVCFEQREVISHLGIITGMKPNQYNIFADIENWTINLNG
jgi:ABC-type transport system substrate-binding protein